MAQRYQRLTILSGAPDPAQIIAQATLLANQSQACGAITDSVYAKTLHVLGRSYWYIGQLDTAITITKRAIAVNKLPSPTTSRANLVHSYYNLARIYGDKSDYRKAIEALNEATAIAIRYPEKWASGASAYAEKAFIYYTIGDYEKAARVAQEGFALANQVGDLKMSANTLVQQSQALIALKDLVAADVSLRRSLQFARQSGELSIEANVYSLLATVATRQEQNRKAADYYQQAFELNRQAHFRYGCAQVLNNQGLVYANKLRQFDKALAIYSRALTYCDDTGARISILNSIGKAYANLNQPERALVYYQQALQLTAPGLHIAQMSDNPTGNWLRVAAYKEYVLSVIQDKADTWLDYAKATNSRQRLRYALDTYQVADQMIDYMRWEHTGQQSKLFWRQKTRGMYERAIETCYRLGNVEQAFRFFEKSRAVMLADQLNEIGARQQLSATQMGEEQRLRQIVNEQQTKLAGIKPDSSVYAGLRTALLTKQDSLDAFLKQLEASNPTYYRYKYDNATPPLADLKQYLKAHQASFVTYFQGDSALYVLGVTGDKATLQRQSVSQYTQTIRQFMPLLASPEAMNRTATVVRFLTLGNSLYRQLLAPLNVPAGRVIVSPDGSFIPFETLSRSATQPDYLVKTYAFSYAYSAHLLLRKNTVSTQTAGFITGDFLGVAPVSFGSSLGQATLAGSDDALKPIAARFGSPTMLTHAAATRRAFQTDVAAYRVIHLFTHATADSTGQEPTLYFADSTLRLSDLGDGALPNAQLVVLAACKTGLGAIQRGEGVFSLARGFSALGVPSVLTTLWSVQNDATYRLTDSFYSYLDQGLPKDVALQRAKQDWLASASGASQLPNYWAGLILIGDTAPLDRPVRWPLVAGAALLLLGAGGAGFWWLRRKRRIKRPLPIPRLA